jgi:hypothetical protein
MALSQSLTKRLFELHDREVVISDHRNWKRNKPLVGRVIGWSFDKEQDDEPMVDVRYGDDLPGGWAGETDTLLLSQVELANQPTAIANCQRHLSRRQTA